MASRNGSGSSATAIATAERHAQMIQLRKQGVEQAEIARLFNVSQQAISKVILKHVRDLPAEQANCLRWEYLERLEHMRGKAMSVAFAPATTTMQVLRALRIWERVDDHINRLLGLYSHPLLLSIQTSARAGTVSPASNSPPPAVRPIDPEMLEMLRKIQEMDPSLAPNDGEGPVRSQRQTRLIRP